MLERSARGEKHPVEDFLFTYYALRPAALRRWSPGAGTRLVGEGVEPFLDEPRWQRDDDGVVLVEPTERVRRSASWVCDLLERTASRPAQLGCFGLHEWAMVHGVGQDDVRHAGWPLRLGAEGSTAVVESLPLRCTHHDAFRFFTPSARPLNELQPTRESQLELEQPGCLHATMDLYKWAGKLSPWVSAELLADCFALARDARSLDMRASPYDLTALGYEPVPVETVEGRRAYVAGQRTIAVRGAALRERLLVEARTLLG